MKCTHCAVLSLSHTPPRWLVWPPLAFAHLSLLPYPGRPLLGSTTQGLLIPDPLWDIPEIRAAAGSPGAAAGATYSGGGPRRRSQPPDLPSLLMDARICYLGMPVRLGWEWCVSVCVWGGEGGARSATTVERERGRARTPVRPSSPKTSHPLPSLSPAPGPPPNRAPLFTPSLSHTHTTHHTHTLPPPVLSPSPPHPIPTPAQLVPAVTELIMAELMYMQYQDKAKPIFMYINSTGTTRADGETVGFETEGTAIYDTMQFIGNEIATVGVGVAIGQACMLLSAGTKGKRYMLPHATAMLQQPRLPPTGQRQAVEVAIRWREVLTQKLQFLAILHRTTGHPLAKLDADLQRPLYMQPADAIEYGVIDKIVNPQGEEEVGGLAGKAMGV